QPRQGGLAHQKDRVEIDCVDLTPLLEAGSVEMLAQANSRCIDYTVDSAHGACGFICRWSHCVRLCEIDSDYMGTFSELIGSPLQQGSVFVEQSHLCTLGDKSACGRKTDARSTAADENSSLGQTSGRVHRY